MLKTLHTCSYGAIYESSYCAMYICFAFSLYHSSVNHNQVGGEVCRWSRIHSFFTKIVVEYLQTGSSDRRLLKQTFIWTSPSCTVGWAPSNQPDQSVSHLYAGKRVVGIFFSRSSHKTISSLREFVVTQFWTGRCKVIYLSIGFTQVFIMIARISCKVKWELQKDWYY